MKSSEVEIAERAVDAKMGALNDSVNQLIQKIERVGHSVDQAVEFLDSPIKKFRQIAAQAEERYHVDSRTFLICVGLSTAFVLSLGMALHFGQKSEADDLVLSQNSNQ